MSELSPALAAGGPGDPVSVSGGNLTWVVIVAVIALSALAVAGWLVREVLAASQGTAKMQEIGKAVQEGAAAYLRRQFRTRELKDSGAILPLGSDWMVAHYDPRIGMAWAQLRRAGGDVDGYVVGPEQALTPLEVLEGYTVESARTVSEAHVSGRIAPGFRGDLTAFADDPVTCGGDALPTLPVLLTVTDGEIVHRADA